MSECLAIDAPDVFLLALRDVVRAQSTMSAVAKEADVDRVGLYRALDAGGNPTLRTLQPVLRSIGYQLAVVRASDAEDEAEPARTG